MASSSSSASNSQYYPRWKYDVFLSFRGEDTRRTFTGHLYAGLKNGGIVTFQDDKRLEHGDSISEEIMKAIEESQVALIVFSKNYATSKWCLNELVKIMDCKKEENGQTVIPVFYDVDPSHVRYQSQSFAEAFDKHESKYKDDVEGMQKVQRWRTSLTAAADLKGYDIRQGKEVPDECFEKLSLEVVRHANGLPLALKMWGSFLHKRDVTEWRSAIEQMKINSNSEIVEKLKISYDSLETVQRDIFLDTACFLRGRGNDEIMPILESCYSGVDIALSVLIEKSLVFITYYGTIQMHDLIQDMGKYIVKMQKDPGERSRIWNVEDFKEVVIENTGTVEAIWFTCFDQLCFSKEAMKNMGRLRLLYIYNAKDIPYGSNCHDGSIEYLPNNLHWFVWTHFPWESLPENFEPRKLVHLELPRSELLHLWKGIKLLPSLRRLDLRNSKRLILTPDFTGMPNLEYLDL